MGWISQLDNTEGADVDGSSVIDIIDALLIAQYYVGLIIEFPYNPEVITSTVDIISTTIYDEYLRPVEEIDPNGQKKINVYDEYHRIISILYPEDEDTDYPTIKITHPSEYNIFPVELIKEYKDNELYETESYYMNYSYFDGFGRKIQEKKEDEQNWITIDFYYDSSGRNYRTSVPYYTGTESYTDRDPNQPYTELAYDAIGRLIEKINTDGTSRKIKYGKKSILYLDENGNLTRKKIDGNLEINQRFDGNFLTSWDTLDPDNFNLLSYSENTIKKAWDGTIITDKDGNQNIINKDMIGQISQYSDPDKGIWKYKYDFNGNVIEQTDAKNQTTKFVYDEVNRIIKKIYPNNSKEQFFYDEEDFGFSLGRLTRIK